jgi:taurine dioxygenase
MTDIRADTSTRERDPGATLAAARVRMAEYEVELGPIGHLAEERERLTGTKFHHFDAAPMSPTIGAEISGIDLTSELGDDVIAEVSQALVAYKVLFFRDQPLTPAQHVAFARRFGELEVHPFIPGNGEFPELVHFEKGADVGGYENSWHHDVTWREVPSKAAVLHAIQVPTTGGDTLFADMCAAYDGLDDECKTRIEGMTAVHDFMRSFGAQVPDERKAEMREKYPLVEHPVVRTHPDSGRKLLFVNRNFTSHILGLEPEESRVLIQRLCRQAEILEYQCRFHWTPDAVAMWDNRSCQHYACSDYWPSIRIMERASITGERPF